MGKILLAYGLPKETVTSIILLYKMTKAIVRSPEEATDFFDIVAGVLQGNISFIYTLTRLRTSKVNRSHNRKWFHIEKGKKQTISR